MQKLVVRAQTTQNWVYGDMIMRIVWALLPDEAQEKISQRKKSIRGLEHRASPRSAPD